MLRTLDDLEPRTLVRQVIDGMEEQDLLTYASAIAFQVLTSLMPLALLVLSLMGFLNLDEVWTNDLAPQVSPGPHRWISFGSGLCVLAWVGTSLVFGFYVTDVANYGSVFGSLATAFLLMTYLYLSACAFLIGAEVDAIVRHGETGSRSGS